MHGLLRVFFIRLWPLATETEKERDGVKRPKFLLFIVGDFSVCFVYGTGTACAVGSETTERIEKKQKKSCRSSQTHSQHATSSSSSSSSLGNFFEEHDRLLAQRPPGEGSERLRHRRHLGHLVVAPLGPQRGGPVIVTPRASLPGVGRVAAVVLAPVQAAQGRV